MKTYIALDRVSFAYRGKSVLTNASWSVGSGITVLMGPNGAGKTTVLSLMSGILTPNAGSVITTGGSTPSGEGTPSTVGLLPQRYDLVSSMTLEETVGYSIWSSGIQNSEIERKIEKSLALVDLSDRRKDRVKSLSGGQRQRLAIACTLGPGPDIILLDEPTVGLDPLQRKSLRQLLISLSKTTPIVLSTHLVDDAVAVADTVTILKEGQFMYDGPLSEFTKNSDLETSYIAMVGDSE